MPACRVFCRLCLHALDRIYVYNQPCVGVCVRVPVDPAPNGTALFLPSQRMQRMPLLVSVSIYHIGSKCTTTRDPPSAATAGHYSMVCSVRGSSVMVRWKGNGGGEGSSPLPSSSPLLPYSICLMWRSEGGREGRSGGDEGVVGMI